MILPAALAAGPLYLAAPAIADVVLAVAATWFACWALVRWDTAFGEVAQDIADMIMPVKDDRW